MTFKVKIDISDVNYLCDRIKKELKSVKGVRVGYIKDKRYPNGFSLIHNALVQEYGNERIPPRPFLRRTLKKRDEWRMYVIENYDVDSKKTLNQIALETGMIIKRDIQRSIDSNIPPPNAKSTVKKKGSTHTLIDTGTLRNSVQIEVIRDNG